MSARRAMGLLVAAVIAGGCLTTLAALRDLSGLASAPAAWRFGLAACAFTAGEVAIMRVRVGHTHHYLTWSETAVVLGLVLLPQPWPRVVAPLCVAAAHLVARRPLQKVAFNAGLSAIGWAAASSAFIVAGGTDVSPTEPRMWLALTAGALAFFLVNSLTAAGAMAFSQGLSVRSVYADGFKLNGLVWIGNTATGLILVVVAATDPQMLLLLPVLVALLWVAYRGYMRATQERAVWEVLQTTSRDLIRPTQADVASVVMERAETLFHAEFVELMLVESEGDATARVFRRKHGGATECIHATVAIASTFWPRVLAEREPFELVGANAAAAQRRELESLGLAMCVVTPLVAQDGCLGTLRIGFCGDVTLASRELQVLSTFANYVGTSLHNARLFESMNKERAKLGGVLDHSSDGILAVDAQGCVSAWNPAMARITGTLHDAAIGMPLAEALPAESDAGEAVTWPWLLARLAVDPQVEAAVAIDNPETGRRWLDLAVSAVPRSSASDDSAVIVARDVTAARELEETQQDFVATVSHELRTPLTPLKGFLTTLVRPDFEPSPETLHDMYRRMLGQVHRLERLVEDLLTTSQVERGQFQVAANTVVIDELVEKALEEFGRPTSHRRGGDAAVAVADAGRVEQVLANLLSNADKYSPPNAPVSVAVERVQTDGHDEVRVRVTDCGPGVPKSQQDAIFDRFRRLGDHLTRDRGGSGLGLYISRHLVEAMGGRLWLETPAAAAGASFVFTLPAATQPPSVTTPNLIAV